MRKIAKPLGVLGLGFLACGSAEQTTIDQFLRAAKSDDGPTVAAMSAVSPPGPVDSWEILEVAPQTTAPFELPQLQEKLREAEKVRDDQLEEGRSYLVANREALDEIIPKLEEDSSFQFTGARGEIQAEWMRLVQDRKAKERAYQDLNRKVERAVGLAKKSLMSQAAIESLGGEVAITEALTSITSPDGVKKRYTITLHKYALSRSGGDPEPSRWVIVDIEESVS